MPSLEKLWSICFNGCVNVEELEKRYAEETVIKPAFGSFLDNGELTAGMLGNELMMHLDGETHKMIGIGGVVSHPSYRRDGAVKNILRMLLYYARENGHVYSGLYPFSHEFYRKFGYELACTVKRCTFPINALKGFLMNQESRLLLPDDDREFLAPVYQAYSKRYQLALVRSDKTLRHLTRSNPYAGNDYAYALFENGVANAYVVFTKQDSTLNVTDYAFTDEKAFRAVLGFLARFSAEYESVRMTVPDDIPLASLLPNPYDYTSTEDNAYMLRVLNTEKALGAIKRDFDFSFVLEVQDDFIPENSGRWIVSNGSCAKTDLPADISLSIRALSQLLSGYTSLSGIAFRSDVTISSARELLERIFVKKPAFIGMHF